MNLEQTLTDELASVAGSIGVPPPPAPAALVQQADAARSRRRLRVAATTLLAAAAVVAAIVAGTEIGRPDASPAPTQPSHPATTPTQSPAQSPTATATEPTFPVGAAPTIPYIVGETLYVGNQPQPGSYFEVQSTGGTALAYRATAGAGGPPVVFRNGRQVAVLSQAIGSARLSPSGTMVAWFETYGGTDHLVVRDLRSGHDVGRTSADSKALNPDFYGRLDPRSVADDGTVVYTTDDATYFSWTPGRTPVRVQVPGAQAPPDGFSPDASYVVLNPSGTWGAWVTDRLGRNPENPESNGVTDGATFEKRGDPRSRFTVTLPEGGTTSKVAWESDTDVLVAFLIEGSGTWEHYLRCHVATDRCEYAPTPANPTL